MAYAYIMARNIYILDIGSITFGETEELMDFLQQKHLLASSMVCSSCNTLMTQRQISDGSIFRYGSCKINKIVENWKLLQQEQTNPPEMACVALLLGVRDN